MALRVLACAGQGVLDALSIAVPIRILANVKSVQTSAVKCLLLNGFIFMGSLFMFAFVIRVNEFEVVKMVVSKHIMLKFAQLERLFEHLFE